MRRIALTILGMAAFVAAGCGAPPELDFPRRLTGGDGLSFTLDEIRAIVDNAELSEDQKREELRSLGIEDEQLIDVLLTL